MIRKAQGLGRQIRDLCQERGLTKNELADRYGQSPSGLSHMIRRGDDYFIEDMAAELGVSPEYFDQYILNKVEALVDLDGRLIMVLRGFSKADAETREKWFKSSERLFGLSAN